MCLSNPRSPVPTLSQIPAPLASYPVLQEKAEKVVAGVARERGSVEEGDTCDLG